MKPNAILQSEPTTAGSPPPPNPGQRILVVEGEPPADAANVAISLKPGRRIQTADRGMAGRETLNEGHSERPLPAQSLPVGTERPWLKNLQAQGVTTPGSMASKMIPTEDELKRNPGRRLEAALGKPFRHANLLKTANSVLRSAERSAYGVPPIKIKEEIICRAEPTAGSPPQAPEQTARRILVVDDEPMMRQLFVELLSGFGCQLDTAENGLVAWNLLQRNVYDLLITDQEMPLMPGLELLRKLRAAQLLVPVVMVSGTMQAKELKQHPELHVDAFLLKPFSIMEFINVVKKVLQSTGSAINSSQLFRDCAMADTTTTPASKPAFAQVRGRANPSHRILVVDDDSGTRQLSMDLLACAGYAVEGVPDGAAGWNALQTFDYDLVVTDNTMPRMTGVEMISKLRSARLQVPVIMATGNPPISEFERRPWLKPDITLQRPFLDDDLLLAVKKILRPNEGLSLGKGQSKP